MNFNLERIRTNAMIIAGLATANFLYDNGQKFYSDPDKFRGYYAEPAINDVSSEVETWEAEDLLIITLEGESLAGLRSGEWFMWQRCENVGVPTEPQLSQDGKIYSEKLYGYRCDGLAVGGNEVSRD